MSDKENIKLSKLYSISDLKAYYYKIKNYDNLWRYHDPVYGHQTYIDHDSNIIKVKDNEHDLERYPEIMYNVYTDDLHKRTKFDVDSQVINIKGSIPDIGIEVVELTDYYHCGDLNKGLFIYIVESLSTGFYAGFNVGDVIVKVKRPEVDKVPPKLWNRHVQNPTSEKTYKSYDINCVKDMMSIFNVIHPNEKLIFVINRNGKELEIDMSIPFKTKIYQRIVNPEIVIKTCPDLFILDKCLVMDYPEGDYIAKVFNHIDAYVDDDMNLVMDIPDTLTGYEFNIDENGNLVIDYE